MPHIIIAEHIKCNKRNLLFCTHFSLLLSNKRIAVGKKTTFFYYYTTNLLDLGRREKQDN